jgi:hypothetical protein
MSLTGPPALFGHKGSKSNLGQPIAGAHMDLLLLTFSIMPTKLLMFMTMLILLTGVGRDVLPLSRGGCSAFSFPFLFCLKSVKVYEM